MNQVAAVSTSKLAGAAGEHAGALHLSPQGHLFLSGDGAGGRLAAAFAQGNGAGLLALLRTDRSTLHEPALMYWRAFAERFVSAVCARDQQDGRFTPPPPPEHDWPGLILMAPPFTGSEYLDETVLGRAWAALGEVFEAELAKAKGNLPGLLKDLGPAWNMVGRVHFNLAENRRDPDAPFAFMATYTGHVSALGKPQHQPLGAALQEYAGAQDHERLLSLLLPVRRAAAHCPWLKDMVESGEVYRPLRWTAAEALRLLAGAPMLEQAGVVLRMPASWRNSRPARPKVAAMFGDAQPSLLGLDALVGFRMQVTLEGEPLTPAEVKQLLEHAGGLALLRGQWVEVDPLRLRRTMDRFSEAERLAGTDGLPFTEAMRLLSGTRIGPGEAADPEDATWAEMHAGPWLADLLKGMRSPEGLAAVDPGKDLHGTLRPYQQTGLRWLYLLTRLGLGACLADDMGLGKTIQVLALLVVRKREGAARQPSLLVVPASLLGNWSAELEKFAPGLVKRTAHPSAAPDGRLEGTGAAALKDIDVVITTYGTVLRSAWMGEQPWDLVIIDEAQAIKNPGTKQTKAVKRLRGHARLALTGTPVENRLSDLWSIFDFALPGLLGSASAFSTYAKTLASAGQADYGPLRELVRPYILRRLKSDKRIVADLPDKTELKAWCRLAPKQAALYQAAVEELKGRLLDAEGIERRGLVLAFLMRFKQLCDHPSLWMGDQAWGEADSGKWARLREIAEVVAAKQEKLLLFTQFREITAPLAGFLADIFGRPGLVLHGGTPVKKRAALVREFQDNEEVPFFVLSLKAGGSGLNLTAAAHVVHFDRWWNPAVEDQATDRAYRIGQNRNVLVHKFICKGTLEERIDALIASKQQLSRELLQGGGEIDLAGMKDDELLNLLSLDLNTATSA